jgi:hypothetical protein
LFVCLFVCLIVHIIYCLFVQARGEGVHLVGSLEDVDALTEPTSPCYPLVKMKPLAQRYITDVLTVEVIVISFISSITLQMKNLS